MVFFVTDLPVRVSLVGVMSSFKSASETSGTLSVRYTKFFCGSDALERWAHRTATLSVIIQSPVERLAWDSRTFGVNGGLRHDK